MSRRHSATKRELKPDLKHGSAVVSQFIGHMLKDGRKSTASRIIYGAIEDIREKVAGQDPIQVLERACLRSFTPCRSSEPRTMW